MAEHHMPAVARAAAPGRRLARGDHVPHFNVVTIDGQHVRYDGLWQHLNLVFVLVDFDTYPEHRQYAARLLARRDEFTVAETALVISSEAVAGFPSAPSSNHEHRRMPG